MQAHMVLPLAATKGKQLRELTRGGAKGGVRGLCRGPHVLGPLDLAIRGCIRGSSSSRHGHAREPLHGIGCLWLLVLLGIGCSICLDRAGLILGLPWWGILPSLHGMQ